MALKCRTREVYHPAVPITDIALHLAHRLVGVALGPKAQHPLAPIGLGYLDPTHRLRSVPSRQNVGLDAQPMVPEVLGQRIDAHAVDARRAFVLAHSFQDALQLVAFENASSNSPCIGWALAPSPAQGSAGRLPFPAPIRHAPSTRSVRAFVRDPPAYYALG